MTQGRRWFDRQFTLGLPPEAFPDIIERIRGTPVRVEERVRGLRPALLAQRPLDDSWSIQENIGHLLDLEPLWEGRLADLLAGAPRLRPADLQNRKTHDAHHNDRKLEELLAEFRQIRSNIVGQLERVSDSELVGTSLHPRLEQPMSITDLFFFVAEHDDHHLARITEIVRTAT